MDYSFPEPEETVQATLARVLELKGQAAESQLVRMAAVAITHTEHDNWNSGIDYYTLDLRLPIEVFVQIEPELQKHEKGLAAVAGTIWRDLESYVISSVRLLPDRSVNGASLLRSTAQLPSFWTAQHFRLFLSHCSSHKAEVGQLRVALATYGVSGFVAHDDIEPSLLWQSEIEKALTTCEALVAIITTEFVSSRWCDQEVGYALGRGVPVLPIQHGAAPHGFIGKVQALPVPRSSTLAGRADQVVATLLKTAQTAGSMVSALVSAISDSGSYAQAKSATAMLEVVPSLTAVHAATLRAAVKSNSQVHDAFGVPDRIQRILSSHRL